MEANKETHCNEANNGHISVNIDILERDISSKSYFIIYDLPCFQKDLRQLINHIHHLRDHKKNSRAFINQFSLSNFYWFLELNDYSLTPYKPET